MSLLDVTVQCFDEIFTIHFFWREIQIPHLLEKFKKCQLKLLCRYYTEPNTNFFIKCNSSQFFDEIFTINFLFGGKFKFFTQNSKSVNFCFAVTSQSQIQMSSSDVTVHSG